MSEHSAEAQVDGQVEQDNQMPAPDPALRRLDRFVGNWSMEGRTLDAPEPNITGRASFRWLPGGFFLEQRIEIDFAGMVQVESQELIGYDPETGAYPSQVYSNMSPVPLPYTWEIDADELTIRVHYGPMDATFQGTFSPDGTWFAGAWSPNPGADEQINVPYEFSARRVS